MDPETGRTYDLLVPRPEGGCELPAFGPVGELVGAQADVLVDPRGGRTVIAPPCPDGIPVPYFRWGGWDGDRVLALPAQRVSTAYDWSLGLYAWSP